jgi:hypothetical protein
MHYAATSNGSVAGASLARIANIAHFNREDTPNFLKIAVQCALTVFSDRPSNVAISLLLNPLRIFSKTSDSLGVNDKSA